MEQQVQVVVISNDPLRLVGLQTILEESVGMSSRPALLEEALAADDISAVLLDSAGSEDVEYALERFRREQPEAKIVVVSDDPDPKRADAVIAAGARGYLKSSADEAEIRRAMVVVLNGAVWAPRKIVEEVEADDLSDVVNGTAPTLFDRMTEREGDVLRLLLNGQTNQQIADGMGIGAVTVKAHMGRMLRKAGVKNRVELTLKALNR